jgi:outer membrane protein OmpA-like peptidoglycan-associated protein
MREKENEWIAIADLMAGAVGVILLFFVVAVLKSGHPSAAQPQSPVVTVSKGPASDPNKVKWPPFISLSEASGYHFQEGEATLRAEFKNYLASDEVIGMLARSLDEYECDVIEVIGHTDEVPMSGRSNLDSQLVAAAAGKVSIADLHSTDNAGLAMARAVAVVHVLRSDPRLARAAILPLSGAQMILPGDRMPDGSARDSDPRRRRIEIRLRRSTAAVDITGDGPLEQLRK